MVDFGNNIFGNAVPIYFWGRWGGRDIRQNDLFALPSEPVFHTSPPVSSGGLIYT
jgi:hypothetical protein